MILSGRAVTERTQWATLAAVCGLMAACSQTPSTRLAAEAATSVPVKGLLDISIDPQIAPLIDVYLVKPDGTLFRQEALPATERRSTQSLYWTVDVSRLIGNPGLVYPGETSRPDVEEMAQRRDAIVLVLLHVADHNHKAYFDRVFRMYRVSNSTRNIANAVLTGSTAVTALFSGPAAAGIGAAHLVMDSAIAELDSTFFMNQTFEAIDKAVQSERERVRGEIRKRMGETIGSYPIQDALSDVERYSGISSMRAVARIMSDAAALKADDNTAGAPKRPTVELTR